MSLKFAAATAKALPIWFVTAANFSSVAKELPEGAAAFAKASGFEASAGRCLILPGAKGEIVGALFGLEGDAAKYRDPFLPGSLVAALPAGDWRFANVPHDLEGAALAFLLASYRFTRYKKNGAALPRLIAPKGVDAARIERMAAGIALGRDLINTPANDMGPDALEAAVVALAKKHRAKAKVVRGAALLKENFPLIHAVGRASAQEPRIVDFSFGPAKGPRITLVGKGVCFDTGGLDIKPSAAMLLMKKDMGGAATALALASMIMDADLPVRLRVIIPIVENAISGNAFRASDIYPSRKGLSVEIGNTDAEGRLILADALALGDEDAPDMMFDFATLTGAARVALGPDLPPFYCADDALAEDIARTGIAVHDPVWRMPLWEPYDRLVDGKISNLNSAAGGPFAGSITAALFLRRFVEKAKHWVHFDVYGWNPSTKPGRPEGGEAQAARLLYTMIDKRFGTKRLAGKAKA